MNYTKKSFTVTAPGTDQYRENWERTFRPRCGALYPGGVEQILAACELEKDHDGYHEFWDSKVSKDSRFAYGHRRWRDDGEILT